MNTLLNLLGSRTRVEILSLLILHPGEKFYLREIERRTGQDVNPIKKELDKLAETGLIISSVDGNRRYVSIDQKCGIYPEIKNLVLKTVALGDTLHAHLKSLEKLEFAFIYGSFAKGEENSKSDIDLFIIGEVDRQAFQRVLSKAKAALGREINSSTFLMGEVRKKNKEKNHFIKEVLESKKIFLIGSEDELRQAVTGK